MSTPGRNDPCHCGSGKKYKKCCLAIDAKNSSLVTQAAKPSSHGLNTTNVTPASQLLMKAVTLHQSGRLLEAETAYRSLLKNNPDDSDALHYLGLIAFQRQLYPEAIYRIEAAIKINPRVPAFHCNLGIAYKALGQFDAAVASFHEAVRLDPNFHAAHNYLGNTLKDMGLPDEAIASYRRALVLRPDFAEAHNNLGQTLRSQDLLDEAIASFRNAVQFNPYYAEAYGNLGDALRKQGHLEEALGCYQQQVKLAPENTTAQHHVASLTGNNTERAPGEYVAKVFDDYADKFDSHLVNILKYDVPKELVELITKHLPPREEKWSVLDLGCGTGLGGAAIAPYASQLVGVDLSSKMLDKARERNLYQRLECADLLPMMRAEKSASYDVVIAADVFVYLGKLDEICAEIKRLVKPGGFFAFSVEALDASPGENSGAGVQQEYHLASTGRYTHASGYISKLASANGFSVQQIADTQIRMEFGKPVPGYLVLFKA